MDGDRTAKYDARCVGERGRAGGDMNVQRRKGKAKENMQEIGRFRSFWKKE